MEGRVGGRCKIRKRGCSSSSSSSFAHKYRFKRAILVGKRGGSSTPVPTWKVNSRSPSSALKAAESGAKGKEASVSARKLAATLWEINDVKEMRNQKESRSKERVARSAQLLPPHLLDPSHSPFSEVGFRWFFLSFFLFFFFAAACWSMSLCER